MAERTAKKSFFPTSAAAAGRRNMSIISPPVVSTEVVEKQDSEWSKDNSQEHEASLLRFLHRCFKTEKYSTGAYLTETTRETGSSEPTKEVGEGKVKKSVDSREELEEDMAEEAPEGASVLFSPDADETEQIFNPERAESPSSDLDYMDVDVEKICRDVDEAYVQELDRLENQPRKRINVLVKPPTLEPQVDPGPPTLEPQVDPETRERLENKRKGQALILERKIGPFYKQKLNAEENRKKNFAAEPFSRTVDIVVNKGMSHKLRDTFSQVSGHNHERPEVTNL